MGSGAPCGDGRGCCGPASILCGRWPSEDSRVRRRDAASLSRPPVRGSDTGRNQQLSLNIVLCITLFHSDANSKLCIQRSLKQKYVHVEQPLAKRQPSHTAVDLSRRCLKERNLV